jgi:hypothetical protein
MKKTVLLLTILMISFSSLEGQKWISCLIDFEEDYCWEASYYNLSIPGNNNTWQVCVPGKTVFNGAHSFPKAILTDSTGPYPANDTSSFIIKFVPYNGCECAPVIAGYYKMDSDSLKDFGRIEFSLDYGTTWLDALSDTVVPQLMWITEKPVLTGRIHQWQYFFAYLPWELTGDTLYYRFTFISDSIETNQDGWLLDDLALVDHIEGVENPGSGNDITIYPNPATGMFTLSGKDLAGETDVSVYDIRGQQCLQKTNYKNNEEISISGLGKGVYVVKVLSQNNYRVKLLVID